MVNFYLEDRVYLLSARKTEKIFARDLKLGDIVVHSDNQVWTVGHIFWNNPRDYNSIGVVADASSSTNGNGFYSEKSDTVTVLRRSKSE